MPFLPFVWHCQILGRFIQEARSSLLAGFLISRSLYLVGRHYSLNHAILQSYQYVIMLSSTYYVEVAYPENISKLEASRSLQASP
jgi:hypothetical protein